MLELYPYHHELKEDVELTDRGLDNKFALTTLFLRLTLGYLLLGELESHREELDKIRGYIDLDDERVEAKQFLNYVCAQGLLRQDSEEILNRAEGHIAQDLDRVGKDFCMRSVVLETALAVAMLKGDKEKVSYWREQRHRINSDGISDLYTVEVLYLGRLMLEDKIPLPGFPWEVACLANRVSLEGGGFIRQVITAIHVTADRAGLSVIDILSGSAARLESDLFPQGPEEPARLEVSDPQLSLIKNNQGHTLEVRIVVTGNGGRIHAVGLILEELVYFMPKRLNELLDHEIPVSEIKRARKREEIDAILKSPNGLIDAVVELHGDLSIDKTDLESYAERLEEALNWVRGFDSTFKAQGVLRMEKSD